MAFSRRALRVVLCWSGDSPGRNGESLFNWWFRPQLKPALCPKGLRQSGSNLGVNRMAVPPYHEMFNPALLALRELGGSCSIAEMSDRVAKIADLSEEDVSATHKGNMTLLEYRLAWTRIYFSASGTPGRSRPRRSETSGGQWWAEQTKAC